MVSWLSLWLAVAGGGIGRDLFLAAWAGLHRQCLWRAKKRWPRCFWQKACQRRRWRRLLPKRTGILQRLLRFWKRSVMTERLRRCFFRPLRDQMESACAVVLIGTLCIGALAIAAAFVFLRRQERRYLTAAEKVAAYAAGDFSVRLPQNENGALTQLLRQSRNWRARLRRKAKMSSA